MTFDQAIAILELLKEHTNDDGKRELSGVQKAILSWESVGLKEVAPAKEEVKPEEIPVETTLPAPKRVRLRKEPAKKPKRK